MKGFARLFEPAGDDWRPNIPYVILRRGNPGFDNTGAVRQVSRPINNPVFYENGVGGRRPQPFTAVKRNNDRRRQNSGLKPSDFLINESLLRPKPSAGF